MTGRLHAEELGVEALAAVVEGTRAPMMVLDASRRVVWCNPAACSLFESTLPRLQGRDVLGLFVPGESEHLTARLMPSAPDGGAVFTGVVRTARWAEREVTATTTTVHDGNRPLVVLTMCDDTTAHGGARAGAAMVQSAGSAGATNVAESLRHIADHVVAGSHVSWCGFVAHRDRAAHLLAPLTDGAVTLGAAPGLPVVVPDALSRWRQNPATREFAILIPVVAWRNAVCVPLAWKNRVVGLCVLTLPATLTSLSEADLAFAAALADHATLAVVDVELTAAADAAASHAERERLARDLHDSISQALFSMTMHASAARLALAPAGVDPASPVATALSELTALARGALAQMRALIFDLHPDALSDEGLLAAFTMQARAMSARSSIPVVVNGGDGPRWANPDMQARVYQEAVKTMRDALNPSGPAPSEIVVDVSHLRVQVTVRRRDTPVVTTTFPLSPSPKL